MRPAARITSVPAPVGGLNARDGIAAMPPTDAVKMDNFFPTPSSVDFRNGCKSWATGMTGNVETLATYNSATLSKLFACAGGNIYDISTTGAVGAPIASGFASNRWQTLNFGSTAANGSFLYLFNGVDFPIIYNGTIAQQVTGSSTPIAITGVAPNLLVQATSFKQRIYMVEANSFRCWYLGVNAVGGTASSIDFGGFFKLGGYLMAVATWSVDNSAGMQEYFVAISSQGEVVTFQGYDPSNAANWSVASHFRIGRPIGRRCYAKVGSDLIFITADGAFPLSKAMLTDRSQLNDSISDKIQNLINNDVQSYGSNFGWQIILYPIGNKLIVNVPYVDTAGTYQYVMNTITGAWCRFTGWMAWSWELFGDKLFYGSGGKVYQADTGLSDDGAVIAGDVQQAFQYFGADQNKMFSMIRPILQASTGVTPSVTLNVDYDTSSPTPGTATATSTTLWGSPWGSLWSSNNGTVRVWHSTGSVGYAGSPHIVLTAKNVQCKWQSTDVSYQVGAVL